MANNIIKSKLDADQVLRKSYDDDKNRLRVDAEVSAVISDVDVVIDAATGDNIAIADETGTNYLVINPDGSINADVVGTVALDASTLAALENITVNGEVSAINFPDTVDTNNGATGPDTIRVASNLAVSGANVTSTNAVPSTLRDPSTGVPVTTTTQIGGKQSLDINPVNVVSVGNSTTTLLPANGVFIGAWEDCNKFATIGITVKTDVSSVVGGFKVQFSSDGINVIREIVATIPAINNGAVTFFSPQSQYFRLVYTNGSNPQSDFTIHTRYYSTTTGTTILPIGGPALDDNAALLAKAVVAGKNPNGTYSNLGIQGTQDINSTTIPLGANEIYRGTWTKWSESYLTLISIIQSDVSGTLYIDHSQLPNPANGVDTDISVSTTLNYDPAHFPILRRNSPLQGSWVRHRYVNGPAGQTTMNLSAIFTVADPGAVYTAAEIIPTNVSLVGLGRTINTIRSSDGIGFQDIPVDSLTGNQKVTVSNLRDDVLIEPVSTVSATQITIGSGNSIRLDASPVSDRRVISINNYGPGVIAVGHSSGITFDSNSIRLFVGDKLTFGVPSSVEFWGITENTGGSQSSLQRSGVSATGTATNPSNALTSNSIYSNITANSQTINIGGFTAGTSNPLVSVKLGVQGNKQSGQTETVIVDEFQSGSTTGSGTISTTSLAGGSNMLYIVVVTRNGATNNVTGVTAGGINLTASSQINITSGNRRMDVWYAYGNFASGAATATLSTSTNAHIVAYRISNADPTTPIQTINSTTGTGTAITGPAIAGTNKGYSLLFVNHGDTSGTPGVGYTEDVDFVNGSGSNTDGLMTERKALVSTGTETATYTTTTAAPWSATGLTITPAPGNNPTIKLSYTLSSVVGATSGNVTYSSSSNSSSTVDITGDRSWTVGDIPNINVITTGQNISSAAANIDWIYLELVDSTGNTSRVGIWQGGKAVT